MPRTFARLPRPPDEPSAARHTPTDTPRPPRPGAAVTDRPDPAVLEDPVEPWGHEVPPAVVAVVVTDSGRPLARVGGLQASEIKGVDGLR